MSGTIILKKPVVAFGETFTALNFREPTGVDIVECGLPISSDAGQFGIEGKVSAKAVRNYIVALANVPVEAVNLLSPADFMAASTMVLGFFGDTGTAAPSSTNISMSDTPGEISA